MFKEEYKKSMSFPMPEGLVQETAEKMRAALAEPPEAPPACRRRGFPYKPVLAAAASFIIIVGGVLIWYRSGGGVGVQNNLSADAGGVAGYAASPETAMLADSDGAETAGDEAAAPQDERLKAPGALCADNGSLRQLSVISDVITPDGPGWGLSLASDAAELLPSNSPWSAEAADTVEAMPVYLNKLTAGGEESEFYLTPSEMKETADSLLITLGRDTEESPAEKENTAAGGQWSYSYNGVEVDRTGAAQIRIESKFSSSAESKTEQDVEAARYYYRQAEPVLQLRIPEFSYTVSSSPSGQTATQVTVYEKSGSLAEQAAGYSLYPIRLRVNDTEEGEYEGGTVSFQAKRMDEYLGDYPILSLEDAGEKLMDGSFQTLDSRPADPTSENIRGVTLAYCSFSTMEYFLPYYCFYVETPPPDGAVQGLNAYIPCYVAAVQDEYLSVRTAQRK